jgi:hypothetical protein
MIWLLAADPLQAMRQTIATMSTASQPRVFLDVNIGEESIGRLVIELFTQHVPKTAEK